MNLFTSDTHFGHARILQYCKRPWTTVEEMNEGLIERWNEVVRPTDHIYHLGDFGMGSPKHWQKIVERLNGYKILILGNHDRRASYMSGLGFDEVHDTLLLTEEPRGRLYLCHEPDLTLGWWRDADYQLCGHVHEEFMFRDFSASRTGSGPGVINVGVDVHDWRPQSLNDLLRRCQEAGAHF